MRYPWIRVVLYGLGAGLLSALLTWGWAQELERTGKRAERYRQEFAAYRRRVRILYGPTGASIFRCDYDSTPEEAWKLLEPAGGYTQEWE